MYVPGFVSHVEWAWSFRPPRGSSAGSRRFSRLIVMDKRGTGLSDPIGALVSPEQRASDISRRHGFRRLRARDAVRIVRGRHPRTALRRGEPRTDRRARALCDAREGHAGSRLPARLVACGDPALPRRLRGRLGRRGRRLAACPEPRRRRRLPPLVRSPAADGGEPRHGDDAARAERSAGRAQRSLAGLSVPVRILHRTGDRLVDVGHSRYLAEHVAGSLGRELDGDDHWPWAGDVDDLVAELAELVTGSFAGCAIPTACSRRSSFTDVVGSTELATDVGDRRLAELLDDHRILMRRELVRFGGREVDSCGRRLSRLLRRADARDQLRRGGTGGGSRARPRASGRGSHR